MVASHPALRRLMTLAQGGMGVIDLSIREDGRFSRLYAVKRPHAQMRNDPVLRAMFLDEGRLAGLIRHVNVISVHDVGEDAEGLYLVMDYVEGISVAALITRESARGGRLPLPLCLGVAAQAARGLHAAHEVRGSDGKPLGIVHRDVSPQNLVIGYDGTIRVTDFGIAKAFGNISRTSTGLLKGNVGYMSPEQLRFHEPDRRSDLFSLGVVLYELLAGRRLYLEDDASAAARRILEEPPPDVGEMRTDVTPELTGLMFELLAKDRDSRPVDGQDVARRLEAMMRAYEAEAGPFDIGAYVTAEFQQERAQLSRAVAEAEARAAVPVRRPSRRALWLSLAGTVIGATIGLGLLVRRDRGPRSLPQTANLMGPQATQGGPWAGSWHTCAPRLRGLDCWGKNTDGQLGDGQTVNSTIRRAVTGINDVVQASGGDFHSCAVVRDGAVYCWGRNADGEIGLGDVEFSHPRRLVDLPPAQAVSAGEKHSCVLLQDGQVTCFGLMRRTGNTPAIRMQGIVPNLHDVVQVVAGNGITCARVKFGQIHCFGRNERGQLGDGRLVDSMTPVPVIGVSGAVDLGVGGAFVCAVTVNGQVLCWGNNTDAQLGIPDTTEFRLTPAPVPGLSDVVQVAVRSSSACALRRTGQVLCWGRGDWGNFGDGTTGSAITRADPRPVPGLDDAVFISAGAVHVCARRRAGEIICWGDNANGQIGDGTLERRSRPVSVAATP